MLLGKEAKLSVRIICHKLTDEQSAARRRKANLLAKGHGYKSSQRNQKLLQWLIFITNIAENKVSAQHIWTIYRARWQIDIYQPYCLHKCQFNLYYFTSIESINFIYFRVINPLFRSISKFKNFINFNTIRMYQPYALS